MEGLMCSLCGEPAFNHTHFKGLLDLWRSAPMSAPILRYFEYKHLPAYLQDVSAEFYDLAHKLDSQPDSAEKSAGMRKLLEAKDCFVRNALP